ncbi:MAG: DUF3465 domain-containing protein [Wenzhouxiangella sp.]
MGGWSWLGVLLVSALVGCGDAAPSNERLEQAFAQARTGVWLSGHGIVVRELAATGGEQRIQVRINDALSIVLHRDTRAAARLDTAPGDRLVFHGRYDFHGGGGSVSMTHSDPDQPGGGGWVKINGVRQD